ncbi:MAG: GvpL/GvpF family gas vesicle protein [Longimicrobiales bacterium]
MSDIVYLYGFVSSPVAVPAGFSGIHGATVATMAAGDVHAVYSRVPADEFSPESMDAQIQDLNWVGARGLEHERVVAWIVDHADILPVSLFALYSSESALLEDANARAGAVRRQLDRLQGQREWDFKVSYDQQRLVQNAASVMADVRALDAEIETASAGKRFLLEKKRADVIRRELAGAAHATGKEILGRTAIHATSVVALPIPRADGLPVVLNAALLVRRDDEAALQTAFAAATSTLGDIGITAQLTGPWAPYRFTQSDDADGSR